MKKIEPVNTYAVFVTPTNTNKTQPKEIKKKLIQIISNQIKNLSATNF